jgi:hypothetical protein
MSLVIGFANMYYTLWNYTVEEHYSTINDKHYKCGETTKYHYIKNISMDIDKVKSLYPNVDICEDLKGKSGHDFSNTKIEYPSEYMGCGRYIGYSIIDFNDIDPLIYYYNHFTKHYSESENEIVRTSNIVKRILELGGVFCNNTYYSSADYEKYLKEEKIRLDNLATYQKRIDFIKSFENGGEIVVFAEKNLRISCDHATLLFNYEHDENEFSIHLYFPNGTYKTMDYQGFEYGLPIVKGTGKRIKNKTLTLKVETLEITDEYHDNYYYLKVLDIINIK